MMYLPDHKFAVAVQVNTGVGRAVGKPLREFLVDFAQIIVRAGKSATPLSP